MRNNLRIHHNMDRKLSMGGVTRVYRKRQFSQWRNVTNISQEPLLELILLNIFISILGSRTRLWNAKMTQLSAWKRTRSSHRKNKMTLWATGLNGTKFKSKKCRGSSVVRSGGEKSWSTEWLWGTDVLQSQKGLMNFWDAQDIFSQLREGLVRSHMK